MYIIVCLFVIFLKSVNIHFGHPLGSPFKDDCHMGVPDACCIMGANTTTNKVAFYNIHSPGLSAALSLDWHR